MGDGNVGAASVFHHLGAKTGIGIFLADASKGALAIFIAQVTGMPQAVILFTGVAAVISHNWPIFLRFRSGKGFSTTIGVLTAIITQPMLILAGPTLAALYAKQNTSIAGCVMFIPLPAACWWLEVPGIFTAYGIALPCLVGVTNFIRRKQVAQAT